MYRKRCSEQKLPLNVHANTVQPLRFSVPASIHFLLRSCIGTSVLASDLTSVFASVSFRFFVQLC